MVKVVPATPELVYKYFDGKPPMYSMRGAVALDGDRVLGVGGVYRLGNQFMVFVDMSPEMKTHKKALIKASRMVLEVINRYTMVMAYVKPELEGTMNFAEHFGFEDTGQENEYGRVMIRWNK